MQKTLTIEDQRQIIGDKFQLVCRELSMGFDDNEFKGIINLIHFLSSHNHNAESIACYLTLHSEVDCEVPELKAALIKFDIAH